MREYKMFQYPRGVNEGGVLNTDICPADGSWKGWSDGSNNNCNRKR